MYFATDFRRMAREALSSNWLLAIAAGIVASLLGADGGISYPKLEIRENYENLIHSEYGRIVLSYLSGMAGIFLVYIVVVIIIGGTMKLGYVRFNRNLLDRANPQFTDIFSRFDRFGDGFLLQLLSFIYIFLWTLLFVIPGIIAAFRYAMAPYILEENPNMTASEAINCSKEMMRGNKWRLFCLHISFIGWFFVCIFTCGIGFLWLGPYVAAAEAAFFYEVSGKFNGSYRQYQQYDQNSQYNQGNQYQQYNQGNQYNQENQNH